LGGSGGGSGLSGGFWGRGNLGGRGMVGWEGWDCGGGGVDGGWLRVKLPTNANRPAPRNAMTTLRDTEDSKTSQLEKSK